VTKKELRQHLRGALAQISPEQLHQRSVQACTLLTSTQEFKRAQIIMVFLSLPNELDTTSLVLHAWQGMKRVLAPKVSWEQRRMLPIEIQSLSDDVSESPLGIREPAQGVPFPVANIDLVVVPVIYSYLDALEQRLKPKRHGAPALRQQPADKA
jgi:5-formyltetrahydrofolate cyclo-ligase